MAVVPYRPTPSTEPEPAIAPYQSFRTPVATPASYGGQLGEAEQQAGRELSVTAAHWGEIAADDASNEFQKQADKLLRGDPNNMIANPDGTQTPDTGYMGLKGGAALRQRAAFENNLDDLLKKTRAGLYSADQRLRFDNFSRRYRAVISSQAGTHADTEAKTYALGVAKSQAEINLNAITQNPNDDEGFKHREADVVDAFVKMAEHGGAQHGDAQWNAAVLEGKRAAANARIRAIGVGDPGRAAAMVEENKDVLGKDYSVLGEHYRGRNEEEGGAAAGMQFYNGATTAPSGSAGPPNPNNMGNVRPRGGGDNSGFVQVDTFDHGVALAVNNARAYPHAYNNDQPMSINQIAQHWTKNDKAAWATNVAKGSGLDPNKPLDLNDAQTAAQFARGVHLAEKGITRPVADYLPGATPGASSQVATNAPPDLKTQPPTTKLGAEDEAKFQEWAKTQSAKSGFNVDTPDYDMRGYWKDHGNEPPKEGGAHFPDTYKLPTHPTFSVESKYSTPENPGGQWIRSGDKTLFVAGPANMSNGIEKTRAYLQNNDPNVQLVVPEGLQGAQPSDQTAAAPAPDSPAIVAARRRADAIERIVNSNMSPRMKTSAIRTVNELATADQLKLAAEEKLQKDQANAGMDEYVKKMAPGQIVPPNIVTLITNDHRFDHAPHIRQQLLDIAKRQSGSDVDQAASAYGPGFWDLYKRVIAPPNDPSRIADPTDLLKHAGPGGDITLAGMDRLQKAMAESRKSVDTHSVEQSKASLMAYAKSKLSFEQDVGPIKIRDPKGEQIFTAQFVPKFLAAYDNWMSQQGKDPWQFLTQENVDKMLTGMRDPKEMAEAKLRAQGAVIMPNPAKLPPAPQGANPDAWRTIVGEPPKRADGSVVRGWDKAIDFLAKNPTKENIEQFNMKYGASGYDAQEIVDALKRPVGPQPPAPNVELERAQAARRQAPASPTANVEP